MTVLTRYFDTCRDHQEYGHLSLDPEYVKRVLNPKPPSEHAKRNAAQLAVLDEWEREQLRLER